MGREVIRPQFDEPCRVRLDKGPEGIQREGKYGIDFEYVVNDDSAIMWLPKEGRDALLASGIQPGDEVQLVKSKRGKTLLFSAERISDAKEPAKPNGHRYPPPPLPESKYAKPNGNELTPWLCVAIDAACAAQAYAVERGLKLEFGAEDIRTFALSLWREEARYK